MEPHWPWGALDGLVGARFVGGFVCAVQVLYCPVPEGTIITWTERAFLYEVGAVNLSAG